MVSKNNQLKRLEPEERLIDAGYADEIDWQSEIGRNDFDEISFLREAAWVVLSSGFRESVVRDRFPAVSTAFRHWVSAKAILSRRESCRKEALRAFGNKRKIEAIIQIAQRVGVDGFESIRQSLREHGTGFLQELPFIGPITACHLAKNLGVAIVKPDRHLVRMAKHSGYESAERMCQTIAEVVGDELPVIDIVLWRYATIAGTVGDGSSKAA